MTGFVRFFGVCVFFCFVFIEVSNGDVITITASQFENGTAGDPAIPDPNGTASGTIIGTDVNLNNFIELSEIQSWSFTTSNFSTAGLNFTITDAGPSPDRGGSGKFSLVTGLPDGFVYFANNGYPEITLFSNNTVSTSFVVRNPVNTVQTSAYTASIGAAAVPEPSTFALLGLGTTSLIAYRRRRRSQSV